MNSDAFLRELVASRLAKALSLMTPEPCLAVIVEEFAESQHGSALYQRLLSSIGTHFSTHYIPGLQLFGKYDRLTPKQYDGALKIFIFDLLIQNPDRTIVHGKPNLFTTGADLWILDHELAFSFLLPIVGRPQTEPWQIHASDINMIQNHVLYAKLKGKKLNFAILEDFLNPLQNEWWEDLRGEIPDDWHSAQFEQIRAHVLAVRDNQKTFLAQVKNLLS